MFTLQLLGGCTLSSSGEVVSGPPTQHRQLALLALIASSSGGVSRDELVTFFWPEEDPERARHSLADSLSQLRESLGKDALVMTSDDVRVNPEVIRSDVARFEELVASGDVTEAIALFRGPFLDGFRVSDAPEFERWVEGERDRLARRVGELLEQVAVQHESTGEWATATEEWRRLAALDPYNSRVAMRTMRALDACGDVAGALEHARSHQARVHGELGLESDPEVAELADSFRTRSKTRVAGNAPHSKRARASSAHSPVAQGQRTNAIGGRDRGRLTPFVVLIAVVTVIAVLLLLERLDPGTDMPTGPAENREAPSRTLGQ